VQFAGFDERGDGCPVLRPLIVAGEERVLPIEHNGAREVRPEMTARMRDEAQRPNDYIYSDKERAILNQLIACSTTFTHYSECSVQELLNVAYQYCKDLDEDDEVYLQQLHDWCATDLKVRQISRLASICHLTEALQRDEIVAEVMRATRKPESSEYRSYEPSRFA
jgi:hypothetical protein